MASSKGPDRTTCAIMAIILGGFGVHKFMMGHSGAGVIQLVVTFVTCGAAGFIGFIEGIIYLTKTDEQFHQEYIVEGKSWF